MITESRTIYERAENALAALDEAANALAEGNATEARMRVDDAHGMVAEILELATSSETLQITYAGDTLAAVDSDALAELLSSEEELTLPDPDEFFVDGAASNVAHFLSEAAHQEVLRLPAGLQLTVIGDDDANGPGLVLELAPAGVPWRVTTGWRELVNFQPPKQDPYFDADPKPTPYTQERLAAEALEVACGEINTILVAGRRDRPTGAFTYRATFSPQAWINDQAVPVDPEGPTEWDCTAFVDDDTLAYLKRTANLRGENLDDLVDGVIDNDDVFKSDPAAPEWIRNWSGPYTIRVYRDADLE